MGNCLNRTLTLLIKNCGGRLPRAAADLPADNALRAACSAALPAIARAYDGLQFAAACQQALAVSDRANVYLEEQAPWKLVKAGQLAEAGDVLVAVLETMRLVAIALSPVTPRVAARMLEQLGLSPQQAAALRWADDASWGGLPAGHAVAAAPSPVFLRLALPEPAGAAPAAAAKGKQPKQQAAK